MTPSHTAVIDPVPLTGPEGTAIALTSTTDAVAPTYSWSVAKDGAATPYATGNAATFSFTPDDDGSYVVTLTVTGADPTDTATDTETFTIANVEPTASVSGPTVGVRGQTLSFDLSATDPSLVDEGDSFTYNVDWDGNGTVDETLVGAANLVASHEYATTGTFTVKVTATDKDGGTSLVASSQAVVIKSAAVTDDPLNSGQKVLSVGGTAGNDLIHVVPIGNTGGVKVYLNNVLQGYFYSVQRVEVFAGAGNDNIQVAGSIRISCWLYGEEGHDRIKSGAGNDVVLGGAGHDQLNGGTGNDIVIGGLGADRMVGSAGRDLLIAGTTSYDEDQAALNEVFKLWTAPGSYSSRVESIRASLTVPLTASGPTPTVQDDGAIDVLTGASGQNWFFATLPQDKITGFVKGQAINDGPVTGKKP